MAQQDSADAQMARNLPAPKTFAPSREDVLSTLGFFFGDPAVPEKLKDYSEHHAMTFHFPDAYYGQNTKIRETLNNLILKSPQDWQTNVGLPFVKITGTTVEWDELRFDVRLLQRVPYEGVSRMQTSLRRRHRDRVVRRGIGMMIGASASLKHPSTLCQRFLTCLPPCRERFLCYGGGPPALLGPAHLDPLLRAGDLQLRRHLRLPHLRKLRLPV